MKIKIVQDSIVFVSGLTKAQLAEASKFAPKSLTLVETIDKEEVPVCTVSYADEGGVSKYGVIFDSTTDEGFMCLTLVASQGHDPHVSAEDKVKCVSEEYAGLIIKMNALEEQILATLSAKAEEIEQAKDSVELINL